MKQTKRTGRLFTFTWPNGTRSAIDLDAVAIATQQKSDGVFMRTIGGDCIDVPAEHGDAFLAALEARAAEVG